jgi:cytochrome c553
MIKEAKNIDFYTTGRQPSEQDFARISAWIKQNKLKQKTSPVKKKKRGQPLLAQHSI